MFRVEPVPMPGNNPRTGQKDGLWRVMFADLGTGSVIPEHPAQRTHAENLSYEDAERIARELEKKLNS
jgi:hypothetical protein